MAIKANSNGLITTITGRISSDSLDKFFEVLYEDEGKSNVLANKFLIETELSWKGLPNDFNVEKSEGNLYEFKEIDGETQKSKVEDIASQIIKAKQN